MSSRNVLFVALDPVSEEQIRRAIETRQEVDDVSVCVLAPATGVGPLKWLMGDEDEARAEAEALADHAANAIEAEVPAEEVETAVGDRDPLVAVEDALAVFPADEIVLAGHADDQTEGRLRRFGLPVERLDGGADVSGSGAQALARNVARGRSTSTPVVVITGVGAVILGAVALLSLLLFLVLWLV
jgi:nucleotide-binding universal stress UspA family protein